MPAYTHLSAEARAIAELDDDHRIAHLAEDHWIDYPRARQALQELERLLGCPERTRMPGLLLHGESNIGKSMVIQKFLRAHPAREFNPDTGLLQVDVLADPYIGHSRYAQVLQPAQYRLPLRIQQVF